MHNESENKDLPLVIREMTAADLPAVVTLENQSFPDPWPFRSFEEILREPGWTAIVAEYQNQVVGYACFVTIDVEAHLTNIAVARPHRRKSVAKRLLDRILRDVRHRSCEYVILEVRPGNEPAITFYRKHGFRLLYRRPGYYRSPVEDALVMVYYLADAWKGD